MIPAVAAEGLAEYVDVFCDEGFFTVAETDRSCRRALRSLPKIHANELACSGGVQVAVKHNALSVDHLERTTDAEIEALRDSGTMPTMLPAPHSSSASPTAGPRNMSARVSAWHSPRTTTQDPPLPVICVS